MGRGIREVSPLGLLGIDDGWMDAEGKEMRKWKMGRMKGFDEPIGELRFRYFMKVKEL